MPMHLRLDLPRALAAVLLMLAAMLHRAPALSAEAPSAPASQDVAAMVKTLEDPTARGRLVQQLRLLQRASQAEQPPAANQVKTATSQILEAMASRVQALSGTAMELADVAARLPAVATPFMTAVHDPERRRFWGIVAVRLALVLGLGYAAALIAGRLLASARRGLAGQTPRSILGRAASLVGLLLLDLVPIAAFAGAAYLTLALVDARNESRLAALAWVNASIIVRLVLAAGRVLLAPDAARLRLIGVDNETAQYLQIWLRRLAATSVFGFFGLQAAALLGLSPTLYATLLALLGLIVVALALVLVMQNRVVVARLIRGPEQPATGKGAAAAALRRRLAQLWHLIAALYLVLLYGVWALSVPNGLLFILKATLWTLLVLLLARGALRVLDALFERGLRIRADLGSRFPGLEARVNRYFPLLHTLADSLVYALASLLILQAWGIGVTDWMISEPGRVLGGALARILGIVVVSVLIWEGASGTIEHYLDGEGHARSARTRTLLTVARNALMVVVALVSTLMVLSEVGVNIAPLLAGAGVLGLAVGFGAQRLVQDVITGVFILFQDLMSVGDVVKLGDQAGLVEAISIRTVRLRDLSGTVHTIPFSAITTVSNLTRQFSFYVFDLGVAYREDVDQVIEVLTAIGAELQADATVGPLMLAPIEIFGVDAFGDSAVVIKGRLKTRPIQQWTVGRAFNRLVKKRFDELGIEIPFPHRTLYFGEDKQGTAPPARVHLSPGVTVDPPPSELLGDQKG